MTTETPAAIAGLDEKLGKLAPGYFADLVVVRGNQAAPYGALIDAKPADVLLTTVSGQVLHGDVALVQATGSSRLGDGQWRELLESPAGRSRSEPSATRSPPESAFGSAR